MGDEMKEKHYIILGHENPDVDSIISGILLERLLLRKQIAASFIIPDAIIELEHLEVCKKYGIDPTIFQKPLLDQEDNLYLLVDHHQRQLKGKIVGVIDHHPTIEENNISYYQNEAASSTTCLICQGQEEFFTKEELQLAIMAMFVDTAAFHSTKARTSNLQWAEELAKRYELDLSPFYQEGLCLTPLHSLEEAALHGLKTYSLQGKSIASSYIQVQDVEGKSEFLTTTLSFLKDYLRKEKLDLFAFIVHDMDSFKTTLYQVLPENITIKEYSEYTSRGSTIIPEIEQELNQYIKDKEQHSSLSTTKLYQKKKTTLE